jgi:predicted nucleic acid-binding protein
LIALDTSVVVAALATWHEGHAAAVAALARRPRLPAPVVMEAYSVLTRLPPPHRVPAGIAEAFLRERFPGAPLTLPGAAQRDLIGFAARAGLLGGAIYDALVAATVKRAAATLLTRDRRAVPAYEAVGVRYELVG